LVRNRDDLSRAYTPGVARVCTAIAKDINRARELTIKQNTIAVVTDGTAVLGLGDIGPEPLCLSWKARPSSSSNSPTSTRGQSLWTQLIPKKSSVSSKRSHPPTAALTLKIYPRHVALKSKHVFAKNSTFQSSTMISTVPPSS